MLTAADREAEQRRTLLMLSAAELEKRAGLLLTNRPSARRDRQFRLVLEYAEGPTVAINVSPTCTPQAFSSGLAADDAGSVIDLVEQWSPPIPGPDPDQAVSSDGSSGSVSSGSSGGSTGSTGSGAPADPGTPVPPVAPRNQNPYPPDVTVTTVP